MSVYERPDAKFGRLQASRIYVYHDRKQSIDPAAVAWRSNEPDPKNGGRYKQVSINPALARRHDFGDFVITVLEYLPPHRERLHWQWAACETESTLPRLVAQVRVGKRPGRMAPRARKRRPKSYAGSRWHAAAPNSRYAGTATYRIAN